MIKTSSPVRRLAIAKLGEVSDLPLFDRRVVVGRLPLEALTLGVINLMGFASAYVTEPGHLLSPSSTAEVLLKLFAHRKDASLEVLRDVCVATALWGIETVMTNQSMGLGRYRDRVTEANLLSKQGVLRPEEGGLGLDKVVWAYIFEPQSIALRGDKMHWLPEKADCFINASELRKRMRIEAS